MSNLEKGRVCICARIAALMAMSCGVNFAAEWKAANTGLTNMDVRSLSIDSVNPSTLYAGTGNGVFKSSNGGASWQGSGLPDRATTHLVIDFANPNIPAERESRSPTQLGLQQNPETRSNLAIVNLGTEPNRFSIELFDGKTGMQAGRVENITVNPQGSFQLNSLLADYTTGVNQGYARVVPSNTEPFVTYAVIIDGAHPGERTGDASLVNSSP